MQYVMDMLFSRITIYPKDEYADFYVQAKDIMKDIDPDDAPFLALAMKTKVNGIWNEDKGFQKQNHIKIYTTKRTIRVYLSDTFHPARRLWCCFQPHPCGERLLTASSVCE